ncbi:hypothetical protein [Ornithinimicrobium sp. W1665]|uniref:hypothetical protein n=1 Tax=Ornithinimicrobium sp. W1665 TaxID=3416666 RepID=UPI003CEE3A70
MVTAVDAMSEESQVATGPFADVEVLEAMLVDRGAGVEIDVDWLVPDIVDASGSAVASDPEGAEGQLLVEMTYVGERWVITQMTSASLP